VTRRLTLLHHVTTYYRVCFDDFMFLSFFLALGELFSIGCFVSHATSAPSWIVSTKQTN